MGSDKKERLDMKLIFSCVLIVGAVFLQGCNFLYDRPLCNESNLVSLDNMVGKFRAALPNNTDFSIFHFDIDIIKVSTGKYRVLTSPFFSKASEFSVCTVQGQFLGEAPISYKDKQGNEWKGYIGFFIDPLITSNIQFTLPVVAKASLDQLGLKSEIIEVTNPGRPFVSLFDTQPYKILFIHNSQQESSPDKLTLLIEPAALKFSMKSYNRVD
jgi:hypothetical protein